MSEIFPSELQKLDANTVKLIAILAMTVDHMAWAVFPGYPRALLPLLMHIFGRITCPIMCYFIAEGYHYTKNINTQAGYLYLLLSPISLTFLPRRDLRIGSRLFRFTTAIF